MPGFEPQWLWPHGDEARRRRASAVVEDGARGREQRERAKGRQQELTGRTMRWSASSRASLVLRIKRRRSPAVAMKMAVMAWLQGTRRRVRRGRASRIQGGARGLTGWAWGCWWLRWCSSAVSGASGDERGRETEEGEGMQRVREKREGTRGVVVARIRTKGGLQREAGGGRRVAAGAGHALRVLLARGGRRLAASRLGRARWAGPAQVRPRSLPSLSFIFICFCFSI